MSSDFFAALNAEIDTQVREMSKFVMTPYWRTPVDSSSVPITLDTIREAMRKIEAGPVIVTPRQYEERMRQFGAKVVVSDDLPKDTVYVLDPSKIIFDY